MNTEKVEGKKGVNIKLVLGIVVLVLIVASVFFYFKKEKESDPTEPVRALLEAEKNNDFDAYKKVFFYPPQESTRDLGVISLSIKSIEISESQTKWYVEHYTGSELAKSKGWTDDFVKGVVAVVAKYSVDYDNTKVPFNEGDLVQVFFVARKDADSPWLILDVMST
jgi:hypothetical protein